MNKPVEEMATFLRAKYGRPSQSLDFWESDADQAIAIIARHRIDEQTDLLEALMCLTGDLMIADLDEMPELAESFAKARAAITRALPNIPRTGKPMENRP